MARAISSFPVPDSPEISTVEAVRAMRCTMPKISCIFALLPHRARVRHRGRGFDAAAFFFEDDGQEVAQRRFIVDDEEVHGGRLYEPFPALTVSRSARVRGTAAASPSSADSRPVVLWRS